MISQYLSHSYGSVGTDHIDGFYADGARRALSYWELPRQQEYWG